MGQSMEKEIGITLKHIEDAHFSLYVKYPLKNGTRILLSLIRGAQVENHEEPIEWTCSGRVSGMQISITPNQPQGLNPATHAQGSLTQMQTNYI